MVIYKITNNINNKIYIGKDKHNRKTYYGSGTLIKQAIKKYGKHNFSKEILEVCTSIDHMNIREIYWIDKLNAIKNGYNIAEGGEGGDTLTGHPNRLEIIEKRRKSNIGKKRTPEFCDMIKKIADNVDPEIRKLAAKKAKETKRKRGWNENELKAHKTFGEKTSQFNKTPEARERVSRQFKGKKKKPFTEEHKKNIGKASKGRKQPGLAVEIEGIPYESLHTASRKLNISLSTLRNRLLSYSDKFCNWNYLKE